MSVYRVIVKGAGKKVFYRLPQNFQQEILNIFFDLSINPYRRDFPIKKLSGFVDAYRLRIERWRVLYRVDDGNHAIEILDIFLKKGKDDYRRKL